MKTAVITGADRGLGLALCDRLLQLGWQVFAGQFMPEWPDLESLRQQDPDRLHLIPLDVGSDESVAQAVCAVSQRTDRVDMLINNAGIGARGEGDMDGDIHLAGSLAAMNVNSVGPLRMTRAFLPLLQAGDRRVCFVSSEAGSIAMCNRDAFSGYCMSKTALNMGVRQLYNELDGQGFRFRLYHPGWLQSYMSGQKNLKATVPPEDSAEAAVRLFTEDKPWEQGLALLDNEGQAWPF